MKILWITNIPSPYRVDFFNLLGTECELTVLFERRVSSERNESWSKFEFENFKGILLHGLNLGVDKAVSLAVIKYLKLNRYDQVVISNIASPTGILAIEYMRMRGIPYLIEGDGGIPKDGKGVKERFKKHIISGAKGYFSTSTKHNLYYNKYGANKDSIYKYPFTSLYSKDILTDVASIKKKREYKLQVGIKEEIAVVSIGQFIYRKGYDTLLNSAKMISEKAGIHIIGGTPTKEYLTLIDDNKLNNIYFHDFKHKMELRKWLMAADIFVLPTREDIWGLVINEAMAMGIPIVTTSNCVAGLELIENDINGYIVPSDDSDILAKKLNVLIEDDDLRIKIGKNNLTKISEYTFEEMVKRHIHVFNLLK